MVTPPAKRSDPTLEEAISEINTENIASLEQWAVGGLQNMATPTFGSRGTTIPGSLSMPGSVGQEAQRKAEERTKRRAKESVSKSGSSSEEDEDPVTLSSDKEEYEGLETPSQSDPVEDSEPPPIKINRPVIRSMLE